MLTKTRFLFPSLISTWTRMTKRTATATITITTATAPATTTAKARAATPTITPPTANSIPSITPTSTPALFQTRTTLSTTPPVLSTTMDPTAPVQSDEADYIAFEDSESDVEIDLSTAPPKKPVPKVPKHFRKSNAKVYDNISVYAPPDSNLIFRCSQKRANWYLSRNLARSLSPTSIHLNFAPAGQGHVNDPYYLEERENKCVICGQETAEVGATMLHVVPEQYRKWFPIKLKSHSSHDIVVACPECNAQWDREAAVVRKTIVGLYKIPLEGVGWIKDHEAGLAKSAAGAVISDWNRLWQEHRDQQQTSTTRGEPERVKPAVPEEEQSARDASAELGSKKKKAKVKKVNLIPRERMKVLEASVVDWWNNYFRARKDIGTSKSAQQKRELDSEPDSGSPGQEGDEPRKKLRPENDAIGTMDATLANPIGSTVELETANQETVVTPRPKLPSDEVDIPSPPPWHSTEVTSEMLKEALDAQATYKAPDYKEHGQLVMAQVMASSREYHEDANESKETLQSWREARPLRDAPEGWRDVHQFIRSWRSEFLKRAKPKHLSPEWRIENPTK